MTPSCGSIGTPLNENNLKKSSLRYGRIRPPVSPASGQLRQTPMTDQRFPKSVRVRKQSEFDRVHGSNVFVADNVLVVKASRNGLDVTRLGLSVGRRVGNAVVRNRWKRRIREAFRKQRLELPVGMDLVVRPRIGADCDYAAIFRSLPRLAARLENKLPQ